MSSYANFYIKDPKTKRYLPIGSFSRSTAIYEYSDEYLPYENVRPMEEVIGDIISDINAEDNHYNEYIARQERKIEFVNNMTNVSVEEKLDALADIQDTIAEYNELHEELRRAKEFFIMLSNIADEGRIIDNWDNPDPYVWGGIEVSEYYLNGIDKESEDDNG